MSRKCQPRKFQMQGVVPINHSSCRKTRINVLSYGIQMWAKVSSVLSRFTRSTDTRTDRQTNRRLSRGYTDVSCVALRYMQCTIKMKFIKTVMDDVVAHLKPQKIIQRLVKFVMYCIITTRSVECYWHYIDETVDYIYIGTTLSHLCPVTIT